jgi:protein tyrosine/serine phosphatase
MRSSLLCLLLLIALPAAGERGLPPSEGIINFGKINDSLYRGAQPDAIGIRNLARLGIKSIINLRLTNDVWKAEAAEASAFGMIYTNVPLYGLSPPTHIQVATLLALIENLPAPVFVHCQYGCDRTGTIIACYRIRHGGWPNQAALEEARKYGLSKFELGMIDYIRDFGRTPTKKQPPTALSSFPRIPKF